MWKWARACHTVLRVSPTSAAGDMSSRCLVVPSVSVSCDLSILVEHFFICVVLGRGAGAMTTAYETNRWSLTEPLPKPCRAEDSAAPILEVEKLRFREDN